MPEQADDNKSQSPATTPTAQPVQPTGSVETVRPILPAEMNPNTLVKQAETTPRPIQPSTDYQEEKL
jgi:hypothetical protein